MTQTREYTKVSSILFYISWNTQKHSENQNPSFMDNCECKASLLILILNSRKNLILLGLAFTDMRHFKHFLINSCRVSLCEGQLIHKYIIV